MDNQLLLSNVRNVLIRLEETIIFGLIERAQYCINAPIYQPGGLGDALGNESLVEYLLHECERAHAKVRRYTSPDEHPFFNDLPEPVLPLLHFENNPLHPNNININHRIMELYISEIIPFICDKGDDGQYGSSAVNDVNLLQSISKRIHYGMFVAESKYRECEDVFRPLIESAETTAIMSAITDEAIEAKVLNRVLLKAQTYGQELETAPGQYKVSPESVRTIYERWIIPMNKDVQVQYLMSRNNP